IVYADEYRVQLEDMAGSRRPNMEFFHRVFGGLEVRIGRHHGRLGGGVGELRGLVIGLRDGLTLEEDLAALELGGVRLELGSGPVEARLGLTEVVPGNPGVDLGQELALLELSPRLDAHADDLAPGL